MTVASGAVSRTACGAGERGKEFEDGSAWAREGATPAANVVPCAKSGGLLRAGRKGRDPASEPSSRPTLQSRGTSTQEGKEGVLTSLTVPKTGRPRCVWPAFLGLVPPTILVPYLMACSAWNEPWEDAQAIAAAPARQ